MEIAIELFALVCVFLSLFCYMLKLINDKGHEQRDETIRSLRARESELMTERGAALRSLDAVNSRLDSRASELAKANAKLDLIAEILGDR